MIARGASTPRRLRWLAVALLVCAPAAAQRDPGWDVRVTERVEVAVGASAPLSIAIAVDRGMTVSKDAAVIIDVAPDDGVTVRKRRLGRGDAVDPEADAPRFALAVRGDSPGDHAVRLHIRFWLCRSRICRPIEVRREARVSVAAGTTSLDAGLDAAPDTRDAGAPARRKP
ncbi:MAG TPA: hypothetical protein VIX73_25380 [Kofleriaceae bacterium]